MTPSFLQACRRCLVLFLAILSLSVAAATAEQTRMTLIEAVRAGKLGHVLALVAEGASLETRDSAGRTPLLIAVRADAAEIARVLVEAGADVNAKDQIRDTPFLYAGAEGRNAILRLILATGRAKLDDTNRYGGTAIVPAAHHGHPETVRMLIEAGLDVDHVNDLGWTALLEAVILGDGGPTYQEIVRLLIDAGARDVADRDGKTPLAHARSRGFGEIAAILEAAGHR